MTLDFFLPSYTPEQVEYEKGDNYFASSAGGQSETQFIVSKIAEKMPSLAGKGKGVCRMEIKDVVTMDLDLLNGKFSTEQDGVVKVHFNFFSLKSTFHLRRVLSKNFQKFEKILFRRNSIKF